MHEMTHVPHYGRNGLRLGGLPFLTVEEDDRGSQVPPRVRANGMTTDAALDEIARRWNAINEIELILAEAQGNGSPIVGALASIQAIVRGS